MQMLINVPDNNYKLLLLQVGSQDCHLRYFVCYIWQSWLVTLFFLLHFSLQHSSLPLSKLQFIEKLYSFSFINNFSSTSLYKTDFSSLLDGRLWLLTSQHHITSLKYLIKFLLCSRTTQISFQTSFLFLLQKLDLSNNLW